MIKKCSVSIGTLKFLHECVKYGMSIKNSVQCYQTDFPQIFSGWAQDYMRIYAVHVFSIAHCVWCCGESLQSSFLWK